MRSRPSSLCKSDDKEHGKFVAFKRLCRKYCALDPCLDRIFDGFDCIMKCLGPILVCVGVALIAFISYVVVFIWLPQQETSSRLLLTPMAGWLYFNIMYNYMRAIWADAGKPGEYVEEMEKQDLEMVDSDDEYDYMVAKQKIIQVIHPDKRRLYDMELRFRCVPCRPGDNTTGEHRTAQKKGSDGSRVAPRDLAIPWYY
eukprot:GEMP01038669.1.p1 GENE.GEMP01038669.1~~GEMP01038669.1.p1  ORF type:complete len:199 (+),score=29.68 GEMP01038669.1:137-733(+)